jgi:hypothetical protein
VKLESDIITYNVILFGINGNFGRDMCKMIYTVTPLKAGIWGNMGAKVFG